MTGTKNDRVMTGVLYGGVWEIGLEKHIYITTYSDDFNSWIPFKDLKDI